MGEKMEENIVNIMRKKSSISSINKREKFVKLAEGRTIKAIKSIRVIGKLGNPSAYSYSDSDVAKIVKALQAEIESLRVRMKSSERSEDIKFKL